MITVVKKVCKRCEYAKFTEDQVTFKNSWFCGKVQRVYGRWLPTFKDTLRDDCPYIAEHAVCQT